jgi:hypothetical protein
MSKNPVSLAKLKMTRLKSNINNPVSESFDEKNNVSDNDDGNWKIAGGRKYDNRNCGGGRGCGRTYDNGSGRGRTYDNGSGRYSGRNYDNSGKHISNMNEKLKAEEKERLAIEQERKNMKRDKNLCTEITQYLVELMNVLDLERFIEEAKRLYHEKYSNDKNVFINVVVKLHLHEVYKLIRTDKYRSSRGHPLLHTAIWGSFVPPKKEDGTNNYNYNKDDPSMKAIWRSWRDPNDVYKILHLLIDDGNLPTNYNFYGETALRSLSILNKQEEMPVGMTPEIFHEMMNILTRYIPESNKEPLCLIVGKITDKNKDDTSPIFTWLMNEIPGNLCNQIFKSMLIGTTDRKNHYPISIERLQEYIYMLENGLNSTNNTDLQNYFESIENLPDTGNRISTFTNEIINICLSTDINEMKTKSNENPDIIGLMIGYLGDSNTVNTFITNICHNNMYNMHNIFSIIEVCIISHKKKNQDFQLEDINISLLTKKYNLCDLRNKCYIESALDVILGIEKRKILCTDLPFNDEGYIELEEINDSRTQTEWILKINQDEDLSSYITGIRKDFGNKPELYEALLYNCLQIIRNNASVNIALNLIMQLETEIKTTVDIIKLKLMYDSVLIDNPNAEILYKEIIEKIYK